MGSKKPVNWGSLTIHASAPEKPKENDAIFVTKAHEVFLHVFHDGKWEFFHVEKLPKFGRDTYVFV